MNTDKMIPIDFSRNITPCVLGDEAFDSRTRTTFEIKSKSMLTALNCGAYINSDSSDENYFVVSFANRPNTGTQPVGDDVMVDFTHHNDEEYTELAGSGEHCEDWFIVSEFSDVKSWKPNHAALLAKFKSEQGAKQMNYLEQEIKKADYIYSYSTTGKDAISFYKKQERGIHLDYLCPDRKVWQSSMMTIEQVESNPSTVKLDYRGDEHKEDAHHIAIMIEKLGNQPQNHIDLAISAGVVDDIVISPDEQVIKPWVADHLKGVGAIGCCTNPSDFGIKPEDFGVNAVDLKYHDIDEDGKMTPVFTQAMADAGELPDAKLLVQIRRDFGDDNEFYNGHLIADKNGVVWFTDDKYGGCLHSLNEITLRPIDNRSDNEKLMDVLMIVLNCDQLMAEQIVYSDEFTITLKD